MIDEESYTSAVNLQWEKLANAQTNEEIQEVLDTWPEKKSFEIDAQSADGYKEKDEDSSNSSSEERKQIYQGLVSLAQKAGLFPDPNL